MTPKPIYTCEDCEAFFTVFFSPLDPPDKQPEPEFCPYCSSNKIYDTGE